MPPGTQNKETKTPKNPPQRRITISFRVTASEKEILIRDAHNKKMELSSFLKNMAFQYATTADIEASPTPVLDRIRDVIAERLIGESGKVLTASNSEIKTRLDTIEKRMDDNLAKIYSVLGEHLKLLKTLQPKA